MSGQTALGVVLLALALGLLTASGLAYMNRARYRVYVLEPDRKPLGEAELSQLHDQARGPIGPARGLAKQRLAMYERPNLVRKLERFWDSALWACVVQAAALPVAAVVVFTTP